MIAHLMVNEWQLFESVSDCATELQIQELVTQELIPLVANLIIQPVFIQKIIDAQKDTKLEKIVDEINKGLKQDFAL